MRVPRLNPLMPGGSSGTSGNLQQVVNRRSLIEQICTDCPAQAKPGLEWATRRAGAVTDARIFVAPVSEQSPCLENHETWGTRRDAHFNHTDLCCVPALLYCGHLVMLQKNPEAESMRNQQ